MSLTLRANSQWWYGKFRLPNSKLEVKNLKVEVKGIRPATLWELGNEVFEASRAVAKSEHDKLLNVITEKRAGVKFAKAQLELATAKKYVSPLLCGLPDQWAADHHIRQVKAGDGHVTAYEGPRSESHIKHSRGALAKFARFMGVRYPEVKNMAGVTGEQAKAFMDSIDAERLSPRTWNYYLVLLRRSSKGMNLTPQLANICGIPRKGMKGQLTASPIQRNSCARFLKRPRQTRLSVQLSWLG